MRTPCWAPTSACVPPPSTDRGVDIGWRQLRVYNETIFEVAGPGGEPSPGMISTWLNLDARFDRAIQEYTAVVACFVDSALSCSSSNPDLACLQSISRAIQSGEFFINSVTFGDAGQHRITFDYSCSEHFYIWPFIEFDVAGCIQRVGLIE